MDTSTPQVVPIAPIVAMHFDVLHSAFLGQLEIRTALNRPTGPFFEGETPHRNFPSIHD